MKKNFELFFFLKEEEKYEDAFQLVYPFINKYPEEFVVFFLSGTVLHLNNDCERAMRYLKKAVQLWPENSLASMSLIHSLTHTNKC